MNVTNTDPGAQETYDALRSRFSSDRVAKSSPIADNLRPIATKLATRLALVAKAGPGAMSSTEEAGLKQVLATLKGVLDGTLDPSALRQAAAQLTVIEGGTLGAPQPPAVPADDGSQTAAALHGALDAREAAVAKSKAATDQSHRNLVALFEARQTGVIPTLPTKVAKQRPTARPLSMADVRAAAARGQRRPARPGLPAIITSRRTRA